MAFLGNLLWFVLGFGWLAFIVWVLAGTLWAITVVGLPFAVASLPIAGFVAFPFGRELVDARLLGGA